MRGASEGSQRAPSHVGAIPRPDRPPRSPSAYTRTGRSVGGWCCRPLLLGPPDWSSAASCCRAAGWAAACCRWGLPDPGLAALADFAIFVGQTAQPGPLPRFYVLAATPGRYEGRGKMKMTTAEAPAMGSPPPPASPACAPALASCPPPLCPLRLLLSLAPPLYIGCRGLLAAASHLSCASAFSTQRQQQRRDTPLLATAPCRVRLPAGSPTTAAPARTPPRSAALTPPGPPSCTSPAGAPGRRGASGEAQGLPQGQLAHPLLRLLSAPAVSPALAHPRNDADGDAPQQQPRQHIREVVPPERSGTAGTVSAGHQHMQEQSA